MKTLSATTHGVLDYISVLFLFCSPYLFELSSFAGVFTYSLAAIHLALTIFTDFRLGLVRIIPFRIHGLIELAVSMLLVIVAIFFRASSDMIAFYFYLFFAITLFIVWLISSYKVY